MSTDNPVPSHKSGDVQMIDIADKPVTQRTAIARAVVRMAPETASLLRRGALEKGDVLATARVAAIQAAKETSRIIPLCHPIGLTSVQVQIDVDEERGCVDIETKVAAAERTGVEMEALTASVAAALTIYDMAKGVDRTMIIDSVRVVGKEGGVSGATYTDPLGDRDE